MKSSRSFALFVVAALAQGIAVAHAAPSSETSAPSAFKLASFWAGGVMAQGSGDTYSGVIAWSPKYTLSDQLALRGTVGASIYKGHGGGQIPVADVALVGEYRLADAFSAGLGAGLQTWMMSGVPSMFAGPRAEFGYHLAQPVLSVIDRISANYFYGMSPGVATHTVQLGAGIAF